MKKLTILVVDDHPMFRESLILLLREFERNIQILEADSANEAIQIGRTHPELNLILLDLNLPDVSGLEGLRQCRSNFPLTPLIVVSMWEMGMNVKNVMSMGANGFISKTSSKKLMLSGIRRVLEGEIVEITQNEEQLNLGARKIEILSLLAQGMSNKEIAENTSLSANTVRDYLQEIMIELNVENRTKAALAAQKLGIVVD